MADLTCDGCGNALPVPIEYVGRVRCRTCGKITSVGTAPIEASPQREPQADPDSLQEPKAFWWPGIAGAVGGYAVGTLILKTMLPDRPMAASDAPLELIGMALAGAVLALVGLLVDRNSKSAWPRAVEAFGLMLAGVLFWTWFAWTHGR
jgi:hypothetical protein